MASVTIASHTPFPFEKGLNIPHDDSFASYLTLIKENFPVELTTARPERLSCQISIGSRRKPLDGELDVFTAEKYFNGEMDRHADQIPDPTTTITTTRTPSKNNPRTTTTRARSRTGSLSSSTSAGNSQSALLKDHRRRSPDDQKEDNNGKKFLGIFRCSCSNKRALKIDTKDSRPDTKTIQLEHKPELQLRELRIERLSHGLKADAFPFPQTPKFFDEQPNERKSLNLVRSSSAAADEDARSESSSELFEIESISTASHPFFRRGGAPATPAAGYEPSEASIEWSVATASAANFEDGQQRTMALPRTPARGQRAGFLMGCVNEKAVSVGGGGGGRMVRGEDLGTVARYRAESCGVVYLGGGGGALAGRALPPGARLHFG